MYNGLFLLLIVVIFVEEGGKLVLIIGIKFCYYFCLNFLLFEKWEFEFFEKIEGLLIN